MCSLDDFLDFLDPLSDKLWDLLYLLCDSVAKVLNCLISNKMFHVSFSFFHKWNYLYIS
jgi:hypothetical protein